MSEIDRILDQIDRGFRGHAWHGPSVLGVLRGVTAKQAAARPIAGAHTIHEIVAHIAVWKKVVRIRLGGDRWLPTGAENFPKVARPTEATWKAVLANLKAEHRALMEAGARVKDSQLPKKLRPNRDATFYHLLHGVVQHDIYHAGQIAVLKKPQ